MRGPRATLRNRPNHEDHGMQNVLRLLPMFAAAACAGNPSVQTDPLPTADGTPAGVAAGVPIVWTARLTGSSGWESLRGSARLASGVGGAAARAEISGIPAGTLLPWRIREGSCADPGVPVGEAGAYEALRAGGDGTAAADARFAATLRAPSYAVELRTGSGVADPVAACADLVRSL